MVVLQAALLIAAGGSGQTLKSLEPPVLRPDGTEHLSEGISAGFDRATLTLTLSAADRPPGCEPVPEVSRDFLGRLRTGPETVAGPFDPIPTEPSKSRLWGTRSDAW